MREENGLLPPHSVASSTAICLNVFLEGVFVSWNGSTTTTYRLLVERNVLSVRELSSPRPACFNKTIMPSMEIGDERDVPRNPSVAVEICSFPFYRRIKD